MSSSNLESANFAFLDSHDPLLIREASAAERVFPIDPVASLVRLRTFGEHMAGYIGARVGVCREDRESQSDFLRRLERERILPREVATLFHGIRMTGNDAAHDGVGDASTALHHLKMARNIAIWMHRTFTRDRSFQPGKFKPPADPLHASKVLLLKLHELRKEHAATLEESERIKAEAEEARLQKRSAEEKVREAEAEKLEWERLAQQFDREKEEATRALQEKLEAIRVEAQKVGAQERDALAEAAVEAVESIDLSEADTRRIIDEQLRRRGWEADSETIRHGQGVRPQKGKNLAIAEWPTETGPVDYVLFRGLEAIAVVEAKRKSRSVPASLEQAKRYAKGLRLDGEEKLLEGAPWEGYRVPFMFATNGRPFLKQLEDQSGIWFLDGRRKDNHGRALVDWFTPDELHAKLFQDFDEAHRRLEEEPTEYLGLREYQVRAIKAVEAGLKAGSRELLVAMATGTGKTRTCIALAYRLLKTRRFNRVLFLVDRTSLAEQATSHFQSTRLEENRTFDEHFAIAKLQDLAVETDTKVHFATVQSMVKRILYQDDPAQVPSVGQYDLILVDEAHRGYLLDAEMSDQEQCWRSESEYISTYRRVLEYFDAVKIGLTATPALHTSEIFGTPIFSYSYREAVIDGFLVDHDPPIRIRTALLEDGMQWRAGEQMQLWDPGRQMTDLALVPDELNIDVEKFNKQVVTENFNRVVCEKLAEYIDPDDEGKTLVFCVNDRHADQVVRLFKQALHDRNGGVDDDAVVKITGKADKPSDLIRHFKNERMPNVAVTVDLLTTGIDVPRISNLVFLRRVRSRILYEQMIGRATRLCAAIDKDAFRIFDAVDIYSILDEANSMKPVVVKPKRSFVELIGDLEKTDDLCWARDVIDQIVVKLHRKKRFIKGSGAERLEAKTGRTVDAFIDWLRQGEAADVRTWLVSNPGVGTILDGIAGGKKASLIISEHEDEVRSVQEGFGPYAAPENYISAFEDFVKSHINEIPALLIVTQRPRDLTRKALKELKLKLEEEHFRERDLRAAYKATTNQDIAATIIGYIRRAALGDALQPYEVRVQNAVKRIKAKYELTSVQEKWLDRIALQLKAETVVDKDVFSQGQFKRDGGFSRFNKKFDGRLEAILADLNEEIWEAATA